MKKFIVAMLCVGFATAVYARCTTQTIMQGGRTLMCTTCCDQWGNCTTNCF